MIIDMQSAVVFIHGKGKHKSHWNVTEFGKVTNIENTISKSAKTFLLQVDNFDLHPKEVIEPFISEMEKYKCVIVCHSLAIVYAWEILKCIPVIGLCLIDTTALDIYSKNETVPNYIKEIVWNIPNKLVVHVHLNYTLDKLTDFDEQVSYYTPFIRKNEKSNMMIHPYKSHMLHYSDSPKIIESIKLLLNLDRRNRKS